MHATDVRAGLNVQPLVYAVLGIILLSWGCPSANSSSEDASNPDGGPYVRIPCDERLDFDSCETRSPSGAPECEWAEKLTLVTTEPCQDMVVGPTCIRAELEGGGCFGGDCLGYFPIWAKPVDDSGVMIFQSRYCGEVRPVGFEVCDKSPNSPDPERRACQCFCELYGEATKPE